MLKRFLSRDLYPFPLNLVSITKPETMEVICLEDKAFMELVRRVVSQMRKDDEEKDYWRWVDTETAMKLLGIKSKTTLQKLRDEGKIRFTQPQKRVILYDKDSINVYLFENSKDIL